jgi:hypothetical protein
LQYMGRHERHHLVRETVIMVTLVSAKLIYLNLACLISICARIVRFDIMHRVFLDNYLTGEDTASSAWVSARKNKIRSIIYIYNKLY